MLSETGRVVAIDKDGLWVETLKTSACAKCAAQSGCGQNLAAKLLPNSHLTLIKALFAPPSDERQSKDQQSQDPQPQDPQYKDQPWRVGDEVVVGVEENAFVVAAIIAYGIPLAAFVAGAFIAQSVSIAHVPEDAISAIGAFIGLFLGGVLVKSFSRVRRSTKCFQALVLARAEKGEESVVALVATEQS